MTLDVPAVVIESPAESTPRPLGALVAASSARVAWEKADSLRAVDLPTSPPRAADLADPGRPARLLRIETAMRDARATLDLADAEKLGDVRATLAVAYGEARNHAEDPAAPFLVAELLRLLARAEVVAGDLPAASALRARARLLDGGRLLGLSEGDAPPSKGAPPTTITWSTDAEAGSVFLVDGAEHPLVGGSLVLSLEPGEHHVRLVARTDPSAESLLFAGFVVVSATEPTRTFHVPPAPIVACSREDLAPALVALATSTTASFSVACERWARLRERTGANAGQLEVQRCDGHGCGAPIVWATKPLVGDSGPKVAPTSSIWRSGWTYAALGAAAVLAGGLAAWRLGAFERAEAPPPTLRWEGVK